MGFRGTPFGTLATDLHAQGKLCNSCTSRKSLSDVIKTRGLEIHLRKNMLTFHNVITVSFHLYHKRRAEKTNIKKFLNMS